VPYGNNGLIGITFSCITFPTITHYTEHGNHVDVGYLSVFFLFYGRQSDLHIINPMRYDYIATNGSIIGVDFPGTVDMNTTGENTQILKIIEP